MRSIDRLIRLGLARRVRVSPCPERAPVLGRPSVAGFFHPTTPERSLEEETPCEPSTIIRNRCRLTDRTEPPKPTAYGGLLLGPTARPAACNRCGMDAEEGRKQASEGGEKAPTHESAVSDGRAPASATHSVLQMGRCERDGPDHRWLIEPARFPLFCRG